MNRAINGAAFPLDDAIRANGDDFIRDYGLLGAQATAYGGNIYGVPRAGNTFKIFYNKTMSDGYNIPVPDQMTQAEFLDVAKKFQAVPGLRWPVAFNALWVQFTNCAASIAGWQMVQKNSSGNVTVNFDDPRFRDNLRFFHDMAQVENLAPSVSIIAAESINRRAALAREECALIMDGPFTLIWLQGFMFNDPGAGRLPFELGIAEMPVLTQADKTRASFNECAGAFYAPSTSRNVLEAYKFMRFICNENFDINGVYMPIYTGSDLNTAVSTFTNFTDRNGVLQTNIFPVPTAIKAVTVPNDSFLGVYPMDPELNKFLPPLNNLMEEQFPIYLNGEMPLDNFIRELTRRGQDIVNNLR
jgi:ABC-type glycerol-3-phosphate transport system substrate-binding protein